MYRPFILVAATLALAVSAPASAQTSTSARDRERERARAERERDRAEQERDRDRDREGERRERERAGVLDTVISFDARSTFTVSCAGGDIVVVGSDKPELRVKARTDNGAIRFSASGSRASLEMASGQCSDGRFEVTVPVGTRVIASTRSGSVNVRGVRGDLEVHSQSGDVQLADVGDRLELESLSGDVVIDGVRGESHLQTISGDIELRGAKGDVEIETVSGDIDLIGLTAKEVRTRSVTGDVTFGSQIVDGGRYEFTTHSGETRLELVKDVGAELSVSTYSGSIDSDFPITLKAGDHGIGSATSKRLNFTLGRGTARIVVESFSGDITLSSNGRR